MKIKDEVTTTEQFELEISMERLLKIIADGIKAGGYYIYDNQPYLDSYDDCGTIRVDLIADDIHTDDLFTKSFAEELKQVLKDEANNNKQKGKTNETND